MNKCVESTSKNTHGNKKVQLQRFAYKKNLVEASGEEQLFLEPWGFLSKLEVESWTATPTLKITLWCPSAITLPTARAAMACVLLLFDFTFSATTYYVYSKMLPRRKLKDI